jgi:hypothetical protein
MQFAPIPDADCPVTNVSALDFHHNSKAHHLVQEEVDENGSSSGHQVTALGFCEIREGEQSVRIKFLLSDESQLGSPSNLNR